MDMEREEAVSVGKGLKRISLAWWGMWALACGGIGADALTTEGEQTIGLILMAGAIGSIFIHLITCWVIDGFSGSNVD